MGFVPPTQSPYNSAQLPVNSSNSYVDPPQSTTHDYDSTGTPISLGTVIFHNIEHPDELPFKFKQVTACHELIGGGRIIQTFGTQPEELTWTGNLFDSSAEQRVFDLMAMLAAGELVEFAMGAYTFSVIITNFTAAMQHTYWYKYTISVQIVIDESGLYVKQPPINLDQQTTTALSQITTTADALSVIDPTFDPSQALSLTTPLSDVSSISTASAADLAPTVAAVQSGQAYMTTYLVLGPIKPIGDGYQNTKRAQCYWTKSFQ
jgi:hypothetical protein